MTPRERYLIREHQRLVDTLFTHGLYRRQSARLRRIRWELDRIAEDEADTCEFCEWIAAQQASSFAGSKIAFAVPFMPIGATEKERHEWLARMN